MAPILGVLGSIPAALGIGAGAGAGVGSGVLSSIAPWMLAGGVASAPAAAATSSLLLPALALGALPLVGSGIEAAFGPDYGDLGYTMPGATTPAKPSHAQLRSTRASAQSAGLSEASPAFTAQMMGLSPEEWELILSQGGL